MAFYLVVGGASIVDIHLLFEVLDAEEVVLRLILFLLDGVDPDKD